MFNKIEGNIFSDRYLFLYGIADVTMTGESTNNYFGISASTAGDVNGDGYSDVIVGATGFDNGQTYEGRAYVYHGSATGLSATANWTGESNQANALFGNSVSTAGDVNGDGYSDVIVGALSYENGQANEGRAYVYHGSATGLSLSVNWTAESDQAHAQFGSSVSTAGDVNGDGYSDVIVGAFFYDNWQIDQGRAYVYHGSAAGLSATAKWSVESDQVSAFFGRSVSTAGDVNGDGYSDIITGASEFDGGSAGEGKAFVYYGNGGTSIKSGIQQYQYNTNTVVASGNATDYNGGVTLKMLARNPFGRTSGKVAYEYKENSVPFSGTNITNSTSFTGISNSSTMNGAGVLFSNNISGLTAVKNINGDQDLNTVFIKTRIRNTVRGNIIIITILCRLEILNQKNYKSFYL